VLSLAPSNGAASTLLVAITMLLSLIVSDWRRGQPAQVSIITDEADTCGWQQIWVQPEAAPRARCWNMDSYDVLTGVFVSSRSISCLALHLPR